MEPNYDSSDSDVEILPSNNQEGKPIAMIHLATSPEDDKREEKKQEEEEKVEHNNIKREEKKEEEEEEVEHSDNDLFNTSLFDRANRTKARKNHKERKLSTHTESDMNSNSINDNVPSAMQLSYEEQIQLATANSMDDSHEAMEEYENIKDAVISLGWELIDIIGDGNCFYRSMARIIHRDSERHLDIRNRVYDHLQSHIERYRDFTVAQEIWSKAHPGTYADHVDIVAASNVWSKCIVIFEWSDTEKQLEQMTRVSPSDSENDYPTIMLARQTKTAGPHYHLIVDPRNEVRDEVKSSDNDQKDEELKHQENHHQAYDVKTGRVLEWFKDKIRKIENDQESLKSDNENLRAANETLRQDNETLKDTVDKLSDRFQVMELTSEKMEKRMNESEKRKSRKRKHADSEEVGDSKDDHLEDAFVWPQSILKNPEPPKKRVKFAEDVGTEKFGLRGTSEYKRTPTRKGKTRFVFEVGHFSQSANQPTRRRRRRSNYNRGQQALKMSKAQNKK